jgi:hypothetical protein
MCLKADATDLHWGAANSYCKSQDGALVAITSEGEQEDVEDYMDYYLNVVTANMHNTKEKVCRWRWLVGLGVCSHHRCSAFVCKDDQQGSAFVHFPWLFKGSPWKLLFLGPGALC